MRFDKTNRRSRAQRTRRDAEREAAPDRGSPLPPHGTPIGRIVIEYHGQRAEGVLLQAGDRCRTHGLVIDGAEPVLCGLYAACAAVSAKLARVPGKRSTMWRGD